MISHFGLNLPFMYRDAILEAYACDDTRCEEAQAARGRGGDIGGDGAFMFVGRTPPSVAEDSSDKPQPYDGDLIPPLDRRCESGGEGLEKRAQMLTYTWRPKVRPTFVCLTI